MTEIQPVVVGKLNAEHAERFKRAKEIQRDIKDSMQLAVEAAMKSAAVSLAEYHILMDALWKDVCATHGVPHDGSGRFGLDPQPDGSVDLIDVEATHKLNCPVHGPKVEGKAN